MLLTLVIAVIAVQIVIIAPTWVAALNQRRLNCLSSPSSARYGYDVFRAMITNSRPGRSGASRTAATSKPASSSEDRSSASSRKRKVEVEETTSPLSKVNSSLKVTSGSSTRTPFGRPTTRPTPGTTQDCSAVSAAHCSHARAWGRRDSNTTWPPGRRARWIPRRVADQASSRSEEHTSELQSRGHLVCRLLLEKQ